MKNIFLKITYILVVAVFLVSCNKEDYTGHSTATFTRPTATYTSLSGNTIALLESTIDPDNGKSYSIRATLSNPSIVDTHIEISKVGGNLAANRFTTSDIVIPAGQTTGIGTVTIFRSGDNKTPETLQVRANADGKAANVNGISDIVTINITGNYHAVSLKMSWAQEITFNINGGTATVNASRIDVDLYIYDSNFNDLGIYDAATGSHPEYVNLESLTNGTYYLIADIWANPIASYNLNRPLKITLDWAQENMASGTFTNSSLNTNSSSGNEIIGVLTVNNGAYTIAAY